METGEIIVRSSLCPRQQPFVRKKNNYMKISAALSVLQIFVSFFSN